MRCRMSECGCVPDELLYEVDLAAAAWKTVIARGTDEGRCGFGCHCSVSVSDYNRGYCYDGHHSENLSEESLRGGSGSLSRKRTLLRDGAPRFAERALLPACTLRADAVVGTLPPGVSASLTVEEG